MSRTPNLVFKEWILWAILLTIFAGCNQDQTPTKPSAPKTESKSPTNTGEAIIEATDSLQNGSVSSRSRIQLAEAAEQVGAVFVQDSGASGTHAYPEIMFGGVCLADFDGDGSLDIYATQGGALGDRRPDKEMAAASANSLFFNDGTGLFRRVPHQSEDLPSYSMGAYAADCDSDGDMDLLVANAGLLELFQNDGQGGFKNVTAASGIPSRNGLWLNAVIMDFDGDSIPDIYAANYMDWTHATDIPCNAPSGERDYCNPTNYRGACDLFLKGMGNGKFEDMSESSGIAAAATRSMGIAAFDADQDGDVDIYVANDGEANLLWINQGDGSYKDESMMRGVAVNSAGKPEASMGVACADIDADGDEDLILTHLEQETHTVYRNDGGFFTDATVQSGVASWSRPDTGFGIGLIDLDNDRTLDLFVANGAVARPTRPLDATNVYAQPDRWAAGIGGGKYPVATVVPVDESSADQSRGGQVPTGADTTTGAGCVSRGASFGDLNGDGRVDVVVAVKDGPLRVYMNESKGFSGEQNSWIAVQPLLKPGLSPQIGARVRILNVPGLDERTLRPHASYLGSSEHVIRFGLGLTKQSVDLAVRWLDGSSEQFDNLELGKTHTVVRGDGQPLAESEIATLSQPQDKIVANSPAANSTSDSVKEPTPNDLVSDSRAGPIDLDSIPPLKIVPKGKRGKSAVVDARALTAWCKAAGLPPAPEQDALDAATWQLVHAAIAASAKDPSAENLGSLAMLYDGHGVRQSAIALYERLVQLQPNDERWWHLLGRAMSKEGVNDRALEAFQQAAKLRENNPATQARLGEAYLEYGQPADAVKAWQRYLKLRNNDTIGYVGLAQAFEANGEYARGLKAAQTAIERRPNARTALVLAARLAGRLGDSAAAARYTQTSSRLTKANDPILVDDFDNEMFKHSKCVAYLRKVLVYYKEKRRFQDAYDAAKLLSDRRPNDAQNWQQLVWLATVLKQQANAAQYAIIATELDPKFAPGWDTIARDHLSKGEFERALELADKAIATKPSFANAHGTRGLALGKLKRFEAAMAPLETAIKANPRDEILWRMRVACFAGLGNAKGVSDTLDQMLQLSPNNVWAKEMKKKLIPKN